MLIDEMKKCINAGAAVLNTVESKPLKGEIVVVKIGGSAIQTESGMTSLLNEVAQLSKTGAQIVLVHGGGPAISDAINASGEQPHFVEGLRVTDDKVLSIAQNVLDGINHSITECLGKRGVAAHSMDSTSSLLSAKKKTIACSSGAKLDIGWVGEISSVDKSKLLAEMENGIPVFASLAKDESGQLYNINADNVAMALAVALSADKLVYVTDVPGIIMDKDFVIPTISIDQISLLIDSGIIRGGMIPKVRSCASGIKNGVGSIVICSGDKKGTLLECVLKPGSTGTMIVDVQLAA